MNVAMVMMMLFVMVMLLLMMALMPIIMTMVAHGLRFLMLHRASGAMECLHLVGLA